MSVSSEVIDQVQSQVQQGLALPIMEAFYTLQGEGMHTGKAAYFIRTAGCDVGCHWCDVKESWDKDAHPVLTTAQILKEAEKYPARIAVITGGEPLMYNMGPLTATLKQAGFRTHMETSGAHPLSGDWDWICLSPKKFKSPLPGITEKAHELKVVVYNKDDFRWAETHAANAAPDCQLFLQPEWSKSERILPEIVEYVKDHPKWRISLQTHKFMHIP